MHEAGLAERVVASLAASAPPGEGDRAPIAVLLRVTDAAHVDPEAVTLHLGISLAERGWADVPITVEILPVTCASCGGSERPEAAWPFCPACGAPLPDGPGRGIEVSARW